MPEATILFYGLVLASLVVCAIALWSAVERWSNESEIERRVRARRAQRALDPVAYLSLAADGPRGEASFRPGRSAA